VFYAKQGASDPESVISSLGRVIYSFAYGFSEASIHPRPTGLNPLQVKGVFLAGRVIREAIFKNLTLYSGTALNGCGRLEKHVSPNKIVAGFVTSDDEQTILCNSKARSPVVDARTLKEYLDRKFRQPSKAGCKILLDVVPDREDRFLRFLGWSKRSHLSGLAGCSVFTTEIELIPQRRHGLEVDYKETGEWNRTEVSLHSDKQRTHWELHELLDKASIRSFDFIKQKYLKDRIKIFLPREGRNSLELKYNGKKLMPRIRKNTPTDSVIFNQDSYCLLPTDRDGREKTLIQRYARNGRDVLCFSTANDHVLSQYEDLADFLDSASPCIEFTFHGE